MIIYARIFRLYSVFTLLLFLSIPAAPAQIPSPGTEGKVVVKAGSIILHKAFFLPFCN